MGCDILMESILKGIVVSHQESGVRFHQINDEFMQHAADFYPTVNEEQLKNCLYDIRGLYSCRDANDNSEKWYAGKQSVADKINNLPSSPPTIGKKMVHRQSTNALHTKISKNVRSYEYVEQNNNNNICSATNLHVPVTKNNNSSTKSTNSGRLSAKSNNTMFRTSMHNDSTRVTARRPNSYAKPKNAMKSRNYHRKHTLAKFSDYELVGDDFLMSVATKVLKCQCSEDKSVRHCGLCVSGQTIRSAATRLRQRENIKIILNIGSVDLLHGHDFVDMREHFIDLMQVCKQQNIQVIITTLTPLANLLYAEDVREKLNAFNRFLIRTYSKSHQVIDISKCMNHRQTHKLMFECYNRCANYVTGSNRSHLLWSHMGRQNVWKCITSHIDV